MGGSLEVLRKRVGEASAPDLVAGLAGMSLARFDDLVDALLTCDGAPTVAPREHEVWPLVNARAGAFSSGGGSRWYAQAPGAVGIDLLAATDPRAVGSGNFSRGVMRALLYCHGLTIEDPVLLAADMYVLSGTELRSVARRSVEAAVASLCEIGQLIDERVVDTFFTARPAEGRTRQMSAAMLQRLNDPASSLGVDVVWDAFEAGYVEGLAPELQEVWRQVRGGNRSPALDLIEAAATKDASATRVFIQILEQLDKRAVVENAVDIVAMALADLDRYGARHDLLCPSRLFAELAFSEAPDPRHAARVHQLADLEVPGLDGLLVEDIVKIRRSSDAFMKWRVDLTTGLERAKALRSELGEAVSATEVVGETLAAARLALLREASNSKVMSRHRGLISFVAGSLGGAIGGATSGVAGISAGALGGIVAQALSPREGGTDHLERHYLLFDRTLRTGA